jgi:hypothetical protein
MRIADGERFAAEFICKANPNSIAADRNVRNLP